MIVVMKGSVSQEQIDKVTALVESKGLKSLVNRGVEKTVIHVIGNDREVSTDAIESIPGVEKAIRILQPYKLVSREFHPENTVINVKGVEIGGNKIAMMAGPCAIESEQQLMETAKAVKNAGAEILRASAYKPRTSPYDFQGMGIEGLKLLKKAGEDFDLVVETEVMDPRLVETVAKYADILRVGARNMQNFDLLKELGKINKPIILKRGMSATIKEWMMAAEYLMAGGNPNIIFCERGIRTFETATRNTLDLNAVALLKKNTHLPVIVDPSHSTGVKDIIIPAARAGIAAGADGILVEVHCDPSTALCDAKQALTAEDFRQLMKECSAIAKAMERDL